MVIEKTSLRLRGGLFVIIQRMRESAMNKTLREMTERIVHVANPVRVLLFGSAVNGK